MKQLAYTLIFLLLPFHSAWAQGEANNWYFGGISGMDFNNGAPVSVSGCIMSSMEGNATISDRDGNLLFYTDGVYVYNANNVLMPNGNGLQGGSSSTQSAVIVPAPGNEDLYYIFTVVPDGLIEGIRYSEVDMSLDGGLGDVTIKNVPLHAPVTEKIVATKHSNGCDVWVVGHGINSNQFLAFQVSDIGVDTIPVISNVGPVSLSTELRGQMKFSPDGTRLAAAIAEGNRVELYDFDNSTGTLSNPISWNFFPTLPYGLEFSPSGDLLYVANWSYSTTTLLQFDLLAGNGPAIQASWKQIYVSSNTGKFGSLQIAPDGKIYVVKVDVPSLGVINYPDSLGTSCNYNHLGMILSYGVGKNGLPNFISSYFDAQVNYATPCLGDSTSFSSYYCEVDSSFWDFGDPNSGPENTSTLLSPKHLFSDTGIFQVTGVFWKFGNADTHLLDVQIHPLPTVHITHDSLICSGDSLVANTNSTLINSYLWQDNSTLNSILIAQPDTYWVELTNVCGTATDTLVLDSVISSQVLFGPDTVICDGTILTLDASIDLGTYNWHNGSTNSTFDVIADGLYWVEATNTCGTFIDSISVHYVAPPIIAFPSDTAICFSSPYQLTVTGLAVDFLWQDGSNDSTFLVTEEGVYWVEASNACGLFTDTLTISVDSLLNIQLGNDTVICSGNSYIIDPLTNGALCLWHNGSNDTVFHAQASGLIKLEAFNACGAFSDSIQVDYEAPPIIDLGGHHVACSNTPLTLDASFSRGSYIWNNGSTSSSISVSNSGMWWVTVTNLCGTYTDTVSVLFDDPLKIDLGADIDACKGDSITLSVSLPPSASILWNNASSDSTITITSTGRYWLEASNACGKFSDQILVYFKPSPSIDLGGEIILCEGGEVELPGGEYTELHRWSDGSTGPGLWVDQPGMYSVHASNSCDTVFEMVQVTLQQLPAIDLGPDTFICNAVDPIIFNLQSSLSYSWDNGSHSNYREVESPGTYWVTATDSYGCSGKDAISIEKCPVSLFLPNTFTPNSDGVNDFFRAEGSFVQDFELTIFNLWGEIVFSSNNISEGWDGTYLSAEVPSGVYTYRVKYRGDRTGTLTQLGKVHLER